VLKHVFIFAMTTLQIGLVDWLLTVVRLRLSLDRPSERLVVVTHQPKLAFPALTLTLATELASATPLSDAFPYLAPPFVVEEHI
jgi:hypothetical protein